MPALVSTTAGSRRAVGLLLGLALDRALGDPRRWHPVAGFGSTAAALERLTYRDSRPAGALHVGVLVAGAAGLGLLAPRRGMGHVLATAAATWAVLGGTSLLREGSAMATELTADDLDAARRRLPSLCGRDPSALDAAGLARATVESVAENTSDATVAPLVWGALAGVPGLLVYRAANTLDAMIGHHSPRYERFGWAAARLDDGLNLAPARLAGVLTVAAAPLVGGSPRQAVRAWRRDGAAHPSPNAGVVEASAAGALGVQLGGATPYPYGVQQRPLLGHGAAPTVADLRRAVRLSRLVQGGAVLASAALAVAVGQGGDRLRGRLRLR
ncbi:cobalamin biosynthesis protein [Rhodococcus sp. X156]|uniref:cobalamin biosynthesis protein n=1 Tax=Rhodococcus sp. X156 TaxID=2499145 RepID=UPI000FD843FA|nr:cobalamin biosynthesis protein [Rhodococcus sp. X156]